MLWIGALYSTMPYLHAVRLHAASRGAGAQPDMVAIAANADAIFPPVHVAATAAAARGRCVVVGRPEDGYAAEYYHYDVLTSKHARAEV